MNCGHGVLFKGENVRIPACSGSLDPDFDRFVMSIHVEPGIRTTYDIDPYFDRFVTDSDPQYRNATDPKYGVL